MKMLLLYASLFLAVAFSSCLLREHAPVQYEVSCNAITSEQDCETIGAKYFEHSCEWQGEKNPVRLAAQEILTAVREELLGQKSGPRTPKRQQGQRRQLQEDDMAIQNQCLSSQVVGNTENLEQMTACCNDNTERITALEKTVEDLVKNGVGGAGPRYRLGGQARNNYNSIMDAEAGCPMNYKIATPVTRQAWLDLQSWVINQEDDPSAYLYANTFFDNTEIGYVSGKAHDDVGTCWKDLMINEVEDHTSDIQGNGNGGGCSQFCSSGCTCLDPVMYSPGHGGTNNNGGVRGAGSNSIVYTCEHADEPDRYLGRIICEQAGGPKERYALGGRTRNNYNDIMKAEAGCPPQYKVAEPRTRQGFVDLQNWVISQQDNSALFLYANTFFNGNEVGYVNRGKSVAALDQCWNDLDVNEQQDHTSDVAGNGNGAGCSEFCSNGCTCLDPLMFSPGHGGTNSNGGIRGAGSNSIVYTCEHASEPDKFLGRVICELFM